MIERTHFERKMTWASWIWAFLKIIKMGALGWHSYKAQKQMISELLANKVTEAEKLLRKNLWSEMMGVYVHLLNIAKSVLEKHL